jgi:hypothetical protein
VDKLLSDPDHGALPVSKIKEGAAPPVRTRFVIDILFARQLVELMRRFVAKALANGLEFIRAGVGRRGGLRGAMKLASRIFGMTVDVLAGSGERE